MSKPMFTVESGKKNRNSSINPSIEQSLSSSKSPEGKNSVLSLYKREKKQTEIVSKRKRPRYGCYHINLDRQTDRKRERERERLRERERD